MGKPMDSLWSWLMALMVLAVALCAAWALTGRVNDRWDVNMFAEGLRSQRLDDDRVQLRRCVEAEHAIMDVVLRGQLSLVDGAAALREAYESRSESLRCDLSQFLCLSTEEIYLRMVLLRAQVEDGDYPNRLAIVRRLRAEYEVLRGRPAPRPDGILSLPDDPSSCFAPTSGNASR